MNNKTILNKTLTHLQHKSKIQQLKVLNDLWKIAESNGVLCGVKLCKRSAEIYRIVLKKRCRERNK